MSNKYAIPGQFGALTKRETDSPPFRRLTPSSVFALMLLRVESGAWKRDNPVIFTYEQAEPFMSRHTWQRSIRQLKAEGFVDVTMKGTRARYLNLYDPYSERWKLKTPPRKVHGKS